MVYWMYSGIKSIIGLYCKHPSLLSAGFEMRSVCGRWGNRGLFGMWMYHCYCFGETDSAQHFLPVSEWVCSHSADTSRLGESETLNYLVRCDCECGLL